MYLEIDIKMNINHSFSDFTEINDGPNKLLIIGNFLSIFKDKKFLTKEESLKILEKSLKDLNNLKKYIYNSIGECHFVLKNSLKEIFIFNSNESPGLFYGKKDMVIYISTEEIDISKKFLNNKLSDFEIADLIFRDFNKRNSFRTIIDEVLRLPSSFFLKIDNDLNLTSNYFVPIHEFCTDNRSLKDLDSDFKFFLENTILFYYKKYNNLKLYSNLSGGIDSTAVTIACKKLKLDVTAFHLTKDEWLKDNTKILAEKINVPVKNIFGEYKKSPNKWWDEYRLNSNEEMEKNLGIFPIANMHYLDFYKKNNFIMFGGSAFGQNYQIFPAVFPVFGMNSLSRFLMNLKKGYFFRFLSTRYFIYLMDYPFFSKICEKIFNVNGKLAKNQKEYLSYLAIDGVKPFLPNLYDDLSMVSSKFYEEYINHFSQLYLKNFLDEDDYKKINSNIKIDRKKIQKYARLISYSRGVFNNKFLNSKRNQNSIIIDPPFVASLSNFLLKLDIGVREIFLPKALHFRYFKNELKWDYFKDYIPKTYYYKNVLLHILKMPFRLLNRVIFIKGIFDNSYDQDLINSDNFIKQYSKFLDENNSVLIKKIENNELKKVVKKIFKDIRDGKKVKLYQVFQIINLEIFLRKVNEI